jgi:hypothetical protein
MAKQRHWKNIKKLIKGKEWKKKDISEKQLRKEMK